MFIVWLIKKHINQRSKKVANDIDSNFMAINKVIDLIDFDCMVHRSTQYCGHRLIAKHEIGDFVYANKLLALQLRGMFSCWII